MSTITSAPDSARQPRDLRNAAVEADQEPDAAKLGVGNGAAFLAEFEPVLVVRGEELLVVMDCELTVRIEEHAAIEELSAFRVFLGDAARDMDAMLLGELGHRLHIASVDRFRKLRAMLRGIEQIARVHAFGKNDEPRAEPYRLLGMARQQLDVRVEIAEYRKRLHDRGAITFDCHVIFLPFASGCRRF